MREWRRAILAVTLFATTRAAVASPVRTDAGLLAGVHEGILTVYKGVPYAAPPVGALRWRGPQPVVPWSGVRLAGTFAPACTQSGVSMPGESPPPTSEDCLYLNIWTPQRRSHTLRPVMVWIHGGGFTTGSASMPLYWGDHLAARGPIVVTVGYRVGPFGFLAHPELTLESPYHSSGNYGIQDQIAALKWVSRNILAFGGDRRRITIAGQSAGAASVSILMSSPLATGLFQRAIEQSGGMFEPVQMAPRVLLANAEREGEAYARSLNAHTIGELRALPATALLAGEWQNVSHPVIEPYVLPESPYDCFVAGRQNSVSILIGSNSDEFRAMIADPGSIKAATFEQGVAQSLGMLPPELLAGYPYSNDLEAQKARLALERDIRFGWDMWTLARLGSLNSLVSVYYYHFTHEPPFPLRSLRAGWGASHYAELWYMFDHVDQEKWNWSPRDRKLADAMSRYWANFVANGDPNGRGLPKWPTFHAIDARVMYLDIPFHVSGVADINTLSIIDTVYSSVRGAPFGLVRP